MARLRIAALPFALVLAGCGSDGGKGAALAVASTTTATTSTTTTVASVSKEDFRALADVRCAKLLQKGRRPPDLELEDPPEVAQQKLNSIGDFYEREADALADLTAPEELATDFKEYVEKTRQVAQSERAQAVAVGKMDLRTLRPLIEEETQIFEARRSLRTKLGFQVC